MQTGRRWKKGKNNAHLDEEVEKNIKVTGEREIHLTYHNESITMSYTFLCFTLLEETKCYLISDFGKCV